MQLQHWPVSFKPLPCSVNGSSDCVLQLGFAYTMSRTSLSYMMSCRWSVGKVAHYTFIRSSLFVRSPWRLRRGWMSGAARSAGEPDGGPTCGWLAAGGLTQLLQVDGQSEPAPDPSTHPCVSCHVWAVRGDGAGTGRGGPSCRR